MTYVFDSCALIAYIRDEEGADNVEKLLLDENSTMMMHAVNTCEVYYDCLRAVGEEHADQAIEALYAGGLIIREDMDADFWKNAGRLKAGGRISLADTFAVSLAAREGAILITSDHHEFDPLIARGDFPVAVRFIR